MQKILLWEEGRRLKTREEDEARFREELLWKIEIKGYTSPQWEAKLSQLPEWTDIEVIDKDGISMYVEYARSRFGVDFTTAYEKK